VEQTAAHCERPIIFALSNPSANVDAHPHDLVRWTGGRGIIATGSPFEPLDYEGRTVAFSQANNVYVFPGIGAGAHLIGARCISDAMLVAAASAVHEMLTPADLQAGRLLPPLTDLRSVAVHVAAAVMRAATADGLATHPLPDDPEGFATEWQYVPQYRSYVAG
jgi:malate dehydrogenase (oxaloacetate-decarboxylating)